jgi:hypothetical protein
VDIVAVGWKFKGARFRLHRHALRFPEKHFRYEGVNDPPALEANLPFEKARAALFEQDPYGVTEEPTSKREARNVFRRHHGYSESCPELAALLALPVSRTTALVLKHRAWAVHSAALRYIFGVFP